MTQFSKYGENGTAYESHSDVLVKCKEKYSPANKTLLFRVLTGAVQSGGAEGAFFHRRGPA